MFESYRKTINWTFNGLIASMLVAVCVDATNAAASGVSTKLCYRRFIEPASMRITSPEYSLNLEQRVIRFVSFDKGRPKPDTTHAETNAIMGEMPGILEPIAGGLEMSLERQLPAGKYLVWCFAEIPPKTKRLEGGAVVRLQVAVGQAHGILALPCAGSGPVWGRSVLDVPAAFDIIKVKVFSKEPALILKNIYLSSQTNDLRLNSPEIDLEILRREMAGESVNPLDVPEPENWLENGSFEAGPGNYNWSTVYQCNYSIPSEAWTHEGAADGRYCLALPMFPARFRYEEETPAGDSEFAVMHRILWLKPDKTYYFRGMFRADTLSKLTVSLEATQDLVAPAGAVDCPISNQWQEVAFKVHTPAKWHGYLLKIKAHSKKPGTLRLDSLSLSDKPSKVFVPAQPVEVGAHWSVPGKIFYIDENPAFAILACNYRKTGESAEVNLRCRIHDYYDRLVCEKKFEKWPIKPELTGSETLPLKDLPTGIFRLVLDGSFTLGRNRCELPPQEYVFSLLRRPPEKMRGTFGSFITLSRQPVEIMSRAGIRRTTTLSCRNDLLYDWMVIEPEAGRYRWADQRVAFALSQGMHVVGNLDLSTLATGGPAIPKWALARETAPDEVLTCSVPGLRKVQFSKKAWEELFENMAAHYKGKIDEWRVVDEPYRAMAAREYVAILKSATAGARRGNPDCRIDIHGGYYPGWLWPALSNQPMNFFDGVSDYARNQYQGTCLKELGKLCNKPIRNVEYNWYASLYRRLLTWNNAWARTVPGYRVPTESVMAAVLHAMCWSGSQGFDLYDARYPGGDMTETDLYKCLFEYDGTLKPAGTAYAVMSGLLDGYVGVTQQVTSTRIEAFLLQDAGNFTVMCRSTSNAVVEVAWSLPAGVYLRDFMGNPIESGPGPMLMDAAPVYVAGPLGQLPATSQLLEGFKPQPVLAVESKTALDEGTGQYVLSIAIRNVRNAASVGPGRIHNIADGFSGIAREYWHVPEFPALKPGEQAIVRVGLNAYRGEKLLKRSVPAYICFDNFIQQVAVTIFDNASEN